MSDYDERPSWREIDKKREKSTHYDRGKTEGEKREVPRDRWQSGRVKEALDRIFEGKKGTIEHDKLYNKLHSAYGSARFLKAVQNYIEKYGLPDDFSTLILVVDAKNESIVVHAIEKLKEVFSGLTDRQKEDMRRKLSIMAMSDPSRNVRISAQDAIDALGL